MQGSGFFGGVLGPDLLESARLRDATGFRGLGFWVLGLGFLGLGLGSPSLAFGGIGSRNDDFGCVLKPTGKLLTRHPKRSAKSITLGHVV